MALTIRERVGRMAEDWVKRGYELSLGIGIAQGFATIGAIGFEGRWDYSAIGTVTNLAARLCGEAPGDQILIAHHVYSGVESIVDVEPQEVLTLKGFRRPCCRLSGPGIESAAELNEPRSAGRQCMAALPCSRRPHRASDRTRLSVRVARQLAIEYPHHRLEVQALALRARVSVVVGRHLDLCHDVVRQYRQRPPGGHRQDLGSAHALEFVEPLVRLRDRAPGRDHAVILA